MKQLLTFSLLLVFSFSFAQKKHKANADPLAGLDTAFQRVLKENKAAGFAVAVVKKNKIVYAKGFGYSDYEKKIPATQNTLFAIGSCTKAFTASLIGLLNKEDKLDYDKPVRNYLPELHFYNNYLNDHVTVRDMMCHRTGLPRHDLSWFLFNTPSKDSLIQRIQYMQPTAELRERWQYNNFMFLGLGKLAEKLSGKTWEENVQEKIFNPLAMSASNLNIADMKKSTAAAKGYTVYKDSIIKNVDYYDIRGMSPAGSINSNVNDMANWVMTWIYGGKFNGKEILPAAYVQEAMSSQMVINGGLPQKDLTDSYLANYGFGWMISSYRGHYRVEHGGNINGFSASTSFFPTDSIGIIVLSNQDGSAVPGIVRNMMADRMLDLDKIDWNTKAVEGMRKAKKAAADVEKSKISDRIPNTKPSHSIQDYTGLFTNRGYGTFDITNRNDSLIMTVPDGKIWLRHYHYDVFELFGIDEKEGIDTTEESNLKIQFHASPEGKISTASMPLQAGLDDIVFTRKDKVKAMSEDELSAYVGEYELRPGTTAKFYIKGENTLYAFIKGQPEYELEAVGKDKFNLKVLKGFSVQFEREDDGKISAVTFVQPNGQFKAQKIK